MHFKSLILVDLLDFLCYHVNTLIIVSASYHTLPCCKSHNLPLAVGLYGTLNSLNSKLFGVKFHNIDNLGVCVK